MPEIVLTVDMDANKGIASIDGMGSKLSIVYAGDIDFTPLVDRLLECISTRNTFRLNIIGKDELDEKESLLSHTLLDIIGKYNEVVTTNDIEDAQAVL